MKHSVALIQMISSQRVETNLTRVGELIKAAAVNSRVVFLPENFAALAAESPLLIGQAELSPAGPVRSFLSDAAKSNQCWIFAGTFPISVRPDGSSIQDGRVRAASIVYAPSGQEMARYDKMHMFDVEVGDSQRHYLESATFEAGSDVVWVDCPIGRVGLTVCYDIRFPELYRRLFSQDCDVIAVPSAFTEVTGEAHFKLLMRARAVENCCFTIAACQGGVHDSGRRTYGHSMVVDPWGVVLGELDQGEGVLEVELDLAERHRLRREMPFHLQRRLPES